MTDTGRRTFWAMGALYVLLTAPFLWPFLPHLGTRVFSADSDSLLVQWILAWDTHAFTQQPLHIFDANAFAPLPNTLAFAENLIGGAIFAAPLFWLTGNMVLAMNAVAVLSVPLSGLGTFLLGRQVGVSVAGAALAGLVYAFTPPRFLRIEQFQLTTIHWIPFCLAFLHRYFDRAQPRDLQLALVFFAAQALTGGHGAVFLLVGIIAMLLWRFGLGEPLAIRRRLQDIGVLGALALLATLLVFLPYRTAQADMGLARTLLGWGTAPASFLATPSFIDGRLLDYFPAWARDPPDAYLFPGWLPLLLIASGAAVAFAQPAPPAPGRPSTWWRRLATVASLLVLMSAALGLWNVATGATRLKVGDVTLLTMRAPWRVWLLMTAAVAGRWAMRRRVPFVPIAWLGRLRDWARQMRGHHGAFYAVLTLFCTWLLVGPPWGVWQWVYDWPVLSFVRVPTRFLLLGLIGVAVLVGMAFDRLWPVGRGARASRATAATILGALCLAEFASPALIGRDAERPLAIDHYIASLPGRFVIAELPLAEPGNLSGLNKRNARYMLHTSAHWQRTVNGYSGILPEAHEQLFFALHDFPNADALARLRAFGVTYVVDHNDWNDPVMRDVLQARYDAFSADLELVKQLDGDRLYTIRPR